MTCWILSQLPVSKELNKCSKCKAAISEEMFPHNKVHCDISSRFNLNIHLQYIIFTRIQRVNNVMQNLLNIKNYHPIKLIYDFAIIPKKFSS